MRLSQTASVGWGIRTTATTVTANREITDVFCKGINQIKQCFENFQQVKFSVLIFEFGLLDSLRSVNEMMKPFLV